MRRRIELAQSRGRDAKELTPEMERGRALVAQRSREEKAAAARRLAEENEAMRVRIAQSMARGRDAKSLDEKTRAASMTRIAHARASPAVARRRTFCPPSAPSLSKPRRSASAPATPLPHHPSTPASHTPANSLSARPPVGSLARQPTSAYCASGMTSTVVPAVFPGAALAIERGWPACASSCSPCRTRAALWWPLDPDSDRAAVVSGRGGRGKRGRAFGNPALKGESLAPERAAAHRSRLASRTALGYACM